MKPKCFSFPRWNLTGSIGCMTSWLNSVWQRPPTSMLGQCLWDASSYRAATWSSRLPSDPRRWGITWSEFSLVWTHIAGMTVMEVWHQTSDSVQLSEYKSAAWLCFMQSDRNVMFTYLTILRSCETLQKKQEHSCSLTSFQKSMNGKYPKKTLKWMFWRRETITLCHIKSLTPLSHCFSWPNILFCQIIKPVLCLGNIMSLPWSTNLLISTSRPKYQDTGTLFLSWSLNSPLLSQGIDWG